MAKLILVWISAFWIHGRKLPEFFTFFRRRNNSLNEPVSNQIVFSGGNNYTRYNPFCKKTIDLIFFCRRPVDTVCCIRCIGRWYTGCSWCTNRCRFAGCCWYVCIICYTFDWRTSIGYPLIVVWSSTLSLFDKIFGVFYSFPGATLRFRWLVGEDAFPLFLTGE